LDAARHLILCMRSEERVLFRTDKQTWKGQTVIEAHT
jgi:hypothetical protein